MAALVRRDRPPTWAEAFTEAIEVSDPAGAAVEEDKVRAVARDVDVQGAPEGPARPAVSRFAHRPYRRALVRELEAEAALDAEMALGHRRVEGRRDLHDRVVLDVEVEDAAHAAVGADGLGHRLGRLVPGPGGAHVVLGLEHEGPRGTDADAVAAVDAGGVGQGRRPLGRDPGVEAAPRDGDGEGVLGVLAAGLDALVAEDALGVVADVEVVVDLHRLGDGRRVRGLRTEGEW